MAKSNDVFLQRELSRELQRLTDLYSVIVMTGPRQSGKTSLCKHHFFTYHYVNLENPATREQILVNPHAFLEQYAVDGLIIDEAQHLPGRKSS